MEWGGDCSWMSWCQGSWDGMPWCFMMFGCRTSKRRVANSGNKFLKILVFWNNFYYPESTILHISCYKLAELWKKIFPPEYPPRNPLAVSRRHTYDKRIVWEVSAKILRCGDKIAILVVFVDLNTTLSFREPRHCSHQWGSSEGYHFSYSLVFWLAT